MSRSAKIAIKPYLHCTYRFTAFPKVGKMRQNEENCDIPASPGQAQIRTPHLIISRPMVWAAHKSVRSRTFILGQKQILTCVLSEHNFLKEFLTFFTIELDSAIMY